MPRYYFDVRQGPNLTQDDEGLELSALSDAEREARHALGDITREVLRGSNPYPTVSVSVRDSQGEHVLSISLTYAEGLVH